MNNHFAPEAVSETYLDNLSHVHHIYEMARFRHIQRSWLSKMGLPPAMVANDAEHTFSGATLAVLLGKLEGLPNEDIFYLTFLFLYHDVGEDRTGDDDPNSKDYVVVDERRAMHDMFINTPLYKMVMDAYDEYKERKTLRSRIAKAADIIDSVRELLELKAKGVPYIDRIPDRIRDKRQCLVDMELPACTKFFDQLLAAGHEVIWDHFLKHANSTFTTGKYGK